MLISGARAYSLNAFTICCMLSTCCTIVRVERSSISASGGLMVARKRRRMRSAESWIGVSGFLISCARRRATSPQAASRWACSSVGDVVEHDDVADGRCPRPAAACRRTSACGGRSCRRDRSARATLLDRRRNARPARRRTGRAARCSRRAPATSGPRRPTDPCPGSRRPRCWPCGR